MSTMQCLAIMPFQSAFDAVFQTVQTTVASAVPGQLIDCYWLKDILDTGVWSRGKCPETDLLFSHESPVLASSLDDKGVPA